MAAGWAWASSQSRADDAAMVAERWRAGCVCHPHNLNCSWFSMYVNMYCVNKGQSINWTKGVPQVVYQ